MKGYVLLSLSEVADLVPKSGMADGHRNSGKIAWRASLLATVALVAPPIFGQENLRLHPLTSLKSAQIAVGARKLEVWLMDTPSKRSEGMMYLDPKSVPSDRGMLFVFPDARPLGFWNQNVRFDLDIAFLDASGKALNVAVMKAGDPKSTPSAGSAKYVLEMKRGGFKRIGLRPGIRVTIPTSLKGT